MKALWSEAITVEGLQKLTSGTLLENLGIQFSAIGADFIEATMPVDNRTIQPYGILHGGATASLAETLGSVASQLVISDQKHGKAVGISLNINHLNSATEGIVTGRVEPVRIGRSIHVWEIRIRREDGKLVSQAVLTVKVLA